VRLLHLLKLLLHAGAREPVGAGGSGQGGEGVCPAQRARTFARVRSRTHADSHPCTHTASAHLCAEQHKAEPLVKVCFGVAHDAHCLKRAGPPVCVGRELWVALQGLLAGEVLDELLVLRVTRGCRPCRQGHRKRDRGRASALCMWR